MKRSPYAGIGSFLYSLAKYREGIPFYIKAIEKDPRAEDFYNLARGYAKLQEKDKALENLNKAMELGYGLINHRKSEADFTIITSDSRYKRLLKKYNK